MLRTRFFHAPTFACIGLALCCAATAWAAEDIRLATTTSTENSGLLKVILPMFEAKYGGKVRVVSVGTGAALKLGENGDADVVLVHARELEDKFMAAGFGSLRKDVMYNDFIIVGPVSDPAGVSGMKDVIAAMKKINPSDAFAWKARFTTCNLDEPHFAFRTNKLKIIT